MKFTRRALIVFILLGLTSLTADMVYEGARSVGGSYIEYLGGPAIGSAIAGSGDLIGYGLRFLSGVLASYLMSSTIIWIFTITGYAIQVVAIPSLALTSSWQIATILYLAERVGKGLRTPTRDFILAEVTEGIGRGKGFGIHEVMDQAGAVSGPVILALAISLYGFSKSFLILLIPGVISVALIISSYILYPELESIKIGRELNKHSISFRGLGSRFWLFTLSMTFFAIGYVHWMIVSYYIYYWRILSEAEIGLAYALAMFTDALIALPIGLLYDKIRFNTLYMAPITGLIATATLLLSPYYGGSMAFISAGFWGVAMGCYETIMRASIADLVDPEKRALAYGTFGLIFGLAWTAGSFIYAFLLSISTYLVLIYTVATQMFSIIFLMPLNKKDLI
jgi:MFS family permease